MGLKGALSGPASRAPVPVFPLAGSGARDAVRQLRLRRELEFVSTPRAAAILLVAGEISPELAPAAIAVHDALGHPRATVLWNPAGAGPPSASGPFAGAEVADTDPVGTIVAVHRQLLTGRRPSEAPMLPDVDPAPWRGVGPYGQGGSGMTGGVPYGRPIADRADDRDGLSLDEVAVRAGPFLPPLPFGLSLDLKLSGDVIRQARVISPGPAPQGPPPQSPARAGDPFLRALSEPVPIAELELARARSHLCWLSDALTSQGLAALSERTLRLATDLRPGDGDKVRRLHRAVRRTGVFRWSTARLGMVDQARLKGLGAGPVARASGLAEDARLQDPSYLALGFEPVLGKAGDAAARWHQRFQETVQSLELALGAGGRTASPAGRVECPQGELRAGSHPSFRLLELLPGILEGREWGDAVTTVVSLDLNLDPVPILEQLPVGAVS